MNNTKVHREKLNLTQTDLAERSGLSLCTIQRVEAGNTPKGHTLRSLARALEIPETALLDPSEAVNHNVIDFSKLRLMNTLAFSFLFIPYANVFFPLLVFKKHKELEVMKTHGLKIIDFQIFWTLATSLLLLISPYLQKFLAPSFPLIMWIFALAGTFNLAILIRTSFLLNRQENIPRLSPISFL